MRSRLAIAMFLSTVTAARAGMLPTDYDWYEHQGSHYALTHITGTWEEAEAEALSLNAHLVTINDASENAWVWDTFSPFATHPSDDPTFRAWIGLHQPLGSSEPNGEWEWASGEEVSYTNWGQSEPNNLGEEDWVEIAEHPAGGQWNDIGLSSSGYRALPGIIEIPEPGTGFLLLIAAFAVRRRGR